MTSINIAGKTNKELLEMRQKIVAEARNFLSANEHRWTAADDRKLDEMNADVAFITQALERRMEIQGGPVSRFDDPQDFPGRQPTNKPEGAKGRQVSDSTYLIQRGESVAATLGQSDISLGDVVRAKLLGDRAALGTSEGGGDYTISTEVAAGVIDLARSKSVLSRAGMSMYFMRSSELRMPRLVADPTFEIKAENAEFEENTVMEFGAIVFYPVLLGTLVKMSREVAEDSPTFSSIVEGVIARSFATTMDRFPLLGAGGGGTRVGLMSDPDIPETGSVGAFAWDDITGAVTTIREADHEPTAVLLTPSRRDKVLNGLSTGSGEWLGMPPSIEGLPMLDSTSIPSDKALVGDFTKLILAVRGGPIIESTTVGGDAFAKHQVAVKLTWRADFGVTHPAAFRRLAGITS